MTNSRFTADQAQRANRVMENLAGADAHVRPDQEVAIANLLEPGARVLVVQATGWGKSAVYWVATALLRAEGAGPALVVSPLLSLMRDQVAAAERAGLRGATLNSSNFDQWSNIETALAAGEIDILLVSPERLANPNFGRRVFAALHGNLGLVVIDEAHAISDWGHDFRPDYRRVADLLTGLNAQTPVLATTATANARVTADVATQLGSTTPTVVLRGPLARASLQLNVLEPMSPIERYSWVAARLPELPGSGIVYVLTVADADRLVAAITAVHGPDYPVAAYTGKLDATARERLEDGLRTNAVKALIATSALGMGFDKPDLGFVVHVGSPPSPVSYYQQVGRAGRAIDNAVVALLPSDADSSVWDYFATASIPDPTQMATVLAALADAAGDPEASDREGSDSGTSAVALEASTGLRRTRIDLMLKQLAVDGAVERVDSGYRATGASWSYDAAHYESVVETRRREADIMRAYTRGQQCLMQLLTQSLDDPQSARCGRCSVCMGGVPAALATPPTADEARTVSAALRGQTQILEPRKLWPRAVAERRGRIAAAEAAEPGRIVVVADAPEWAGTLTAARQGDRAALADLAAAAVRILTQWRRDWTARPEVVASLQLTEGPDPVESVADEVARVGRLPRITLPVPRGAAPGREASGAQEASHWFAALSVPTPVQNEVRGRVVLLTVDRSASGWPVTVATALLRTAGASAVLPLVIHRPA